MPTRRNGRKPESTDSRTWSQHVAGNALLALVHLGHLHSNLLAQLVLQRSSKAWIKQSARMPALHTSSPKHGGKTRNQQQSKEGCGGCGPGPRNLPRMRSRARGFFSSSVFGCFRGMITGTWKRKWKLQGLQGLYRDYGVYFGGYKGIMENKK